MQLKLEGRRAQKVFLQKVSWDLQGQLTPCLTDGNVLECVGERKRLEPSNLLGVGEGTCELLLWEGICSPFTNPSWTTLGEKRCETVDWVCWLLGACCAGPTRMLLRNSVTPGAWEQHRNSKEKSRERKRKRKRENMRRRKREKEKGGERFVTLPFTKSNKLIHD